MPTATKTKTKIERVPVTLRLKPYIMQYLRIKAATNEEKANIIVENALAQLILSKDKLNVAQDHAFLMWSANAGRAKYTLTISTQILGHLRMIARQANTQISLTAEAALVAEIYRDIALADSGTLADPVLLSALKVFQKHELQDLQGR